MGVIRASVNAQPPHAAHILHHFEVILDVIEGPLT